MITPQQIQQQLIGLQSSRSPAVWIRKDIAEHIVGKERLAASGLAVSAFKEGSVLTKRELRRLPKRFNPREDQALVYVDRLEMIEVILEFVSRSTRTPKAQQAELFVEEEGE